MDLNIIITESEILNTPNDVSLGELARSKYWDKRNELEKIFDIDPDSFDICILCGRETPYLKSTNISDRIGYVEGAGQGCYQPFTCDKV